MGQSEPVEELPGWVTLVRAPNPGPMTLDGTNTWVLRAPGAEFATVIDPGPLDEGHLERVAALGPYRQILLTHGHDDHIGGADRLAEMLGGVPVGSVPVPRPADGLTIEALATPGHTADSVCFLAASGNARLMFTGDTILGRGSTVVAWPDGDLGAYLSSLGTLSAYPLMMLPGHGPVRADCAEMAAAYVAHRRERLGQVRAAMAAGADTAEAIVDAVYPEIDPTIRFAAEMSARAQLDYLRRESQPGRERLDPL
jgi:glyoxylase-like metal-dependent hydrolase (beta-lactamase superfamily II)